MGTYIHLYFDPRGIDADSWASAYDEALAMLEAWPTRLLGWGSRVLYGCRMPMYTRSIRDAEGPSASFSVMGDRASLQCAECQTVSRAVGGRAVKTPPDILHLAAKEREERRFLCCAFGNKTQGLPYHLAVLAAGMVFEERFSRHVFVSGDIDRDDAETARRMAAPLVGRELALPVVVDAARLIERLRTKLDGRVLDEALEHLFRGHDSEVLEAQVRARRGDACDQWWCAALARAGTEDGRCDDALLVAWLNAGRSVADAARLACVDPQGPRFAPAAFVDALADTWLVVPLEARARATQRVEGASDRAHAMSLWMLDNAVGGRHLRVHAPLEDVTSALREVLGDPACVAALREKTEAALQKTREMSAGVARFTRGIARDRHAEFERLATLRAPDAMSEDTRVAVECLAWNVRRALQTLRGEAGAGASLDDVESLRQRIVAQLYGHTPTLTEDAWDVLLGLEDPAELAWVLALARLAAQEIHLFAVRRALLENPTLRAHAMALSRDDAEMARVGEEIARATATSSRR